MNATGTKPHAAVQLEERYGITDVSLKTLAAIIAKGQAKFVAFGNSDRKIYAVPVSGTPGDAPIVVNCVYVEPTPEFKYGAIITVLPPKLNWQARHEQCKYERKLDGQRNRAEAKRFRQANADDDENDFDS